MCVICISVKERPVSQSEEEHEVARMWKGAIVCGTQLVPVFWLQVTETKLKWLNQKEHNGKGQDTVFELSLYH